MTAKHWEALEFMLHHGLQPDASDLLHAVTSTDAVTACRLLKQYGARDEHYKALQSAVQQGRRDVVDMLLRSGEPLLTCYVTAAELDAAITAAADKGDLGIVSDVLAMLDSNSRPGLVSEPSVKQILGNGLQAACQGHQTCDGLPSRETSSYKR
jgi:hypothetical protein